MGVLLDRLHRLPDGRRVRLRLARPRDQRLLGGLLDDLGLAADELDARRVLRCSPGRSVTVCATAWEGTRERLVGLGAMTLPARQETLLAGDPVVARLVEAALRDHAGTWARRVA